VRALATLERGAAGLLVPAASLGGSSLVVPFDRLRAGLRIDVRTMSIRNS
jgi:hypothetical protein